MPGDLNRKTTTKKYLILKPIKSLDLGGREYYTMKKKFVQNNL